MTKTCERAIYELLKTLANGDVFAMRAPDNHAGPFIIFQRVDRNTEIKKTLNRTPGTAGLAQVTMRIDAYADSYYDAKDLATSIEDILDGYTGTVLHGTNSPQDFVVIGSVSLQNDFDIVDKTEEPLLFRVSASYLIIHEQ